jgi:triacylglycerol esterase/lipase EstA (alpha/beta hydrolase family)
MNGRIQRWEVLGRLLLGLLAFCTCWWLGAAWLGVLVAALVFWFHCLVMGGMFVSLLVINRTAAPGAWRLLRAWAGEVLACERVFAWQQPFAAHAQADFVPVNSAQRGVLLLHGFTCNRGLWNSWRERLTAAGHPHIALTMEPAFGAIDTYASLIEAAVQRLTAITGEPPLVVAHSMGGLAARAWWRQFGAGRLPPRIVTLATPHQGTLMARFSFSTNSRQMRLGSDWLAALAASESPALGAYFDCYYSRCDQIVCPAGHAVLAGSRSIELPATGHLAIVFHPRVWADVLALLRQPRLDQACSTPRRI